MMSDLITSSLHTFIGTLKMYINENIMYYTFKDLDFGFAIFQGKTRDLYFSQKQLPRKMKARLVIIECAG